MIETLIGGEIELPKTKQLVIHGADNTPVLTIHLDRTDAVFEFHGDMPVDERAKEFIAALGRLGADIARENRRAGQADMKRRAMEVVASHSAGIGGLRARQIVALLAGLRIEP